MAEFNKLVPKTDDPSFLNYSRPVDAGPVDRSYGSLFENVGNMAGLAITATDNAIKKSIQDPLRRDLERVRDEEFGVNDATAAAAAGLPPTQARGDNTTPASLFNADGTVARPPSGTARGAPPGVTKLGATLSRYQEAYNSGMMSKSMYDGRLNAIIKQYKAANPGYEEEIDKMSASVVGFNPANSLRSSLLADMDATARAAGSQRNQDLQFIAQNAEYLNGWKTVYEDVMTGKNNMFDVYQYVMDKKQNKGLLDAQHRERQAARERGEDVSQVAYTQAMTDVTKNAQSFIEDGIRRSNLLRTLEQLRTNPGSLTKQQVDEAVARLNQLEMDLGNQTNRILMGVDPHTGQRANPGYLIDIKDGAKIETIRQQAQAFLKPYRDAIVGQHTGVLDALVTSNRVSQNLATRRVAEAFPELEIAKAVQEVGGMPAWNAIQSNGDIVNRLQNVTAQGVARMMTSNGLAPVAPGSERPASASAAGDVLKKGTPTMTPAERVQIMDNHTRAHIRALMMPEVQANSAMVDRGFQYMFGQENKDFLSKHFHSKDHLEVWSRMTDPKVTEVAKRVGGTALGNYAAWATHSFGGVFSTEARGLSEALKVTPRAKVEFDWDSYQFKATLTAAPGAPREGQTIPGNVQAKVHSLNKAVGNIVPILEAAGVDPKLHLNSTFRAMGIKLDEQAANRTNDASAASTTAIPEGVGRSVTNAARGAVQGARGAAGEVRRGAGMETQGEAVDRLLKFTMEDNSGSLQSFLSDPTRGGTGLSFPDGNRVREAWEVVDWAESLDSGTIFMQNSDEERLRAEGRSRLQRNPR